MQKMLRKLDLIVLILIAVIAAGLSVLDFFNLAEVQVESYPLFTLFLLSMVCLHLIVSHFATEDFRDESVDFLRKINSGIESPESRRFADSIEMETYLGNRILEAKRSICDLTWKVRIGEGFSSGSRQLAHGYLESCIAKVSDRLAYREIFVFNDPRRVEKLERRLAERKAGYSCRYFREDQPIPRLQFVIVDNEEVFFFASAADSPLLAIRSNELGRVMKSYFEAAWAAARPLKSALSVDETELAYVRGTFAVNTDASKLPKVSKGS